MLLAYAHVLHMPPADIIALGLTAILASIPVALPATFTLAAAFGARALANLGVLPTRLSAVDEAASMDVLCADKTGTLTRNELRVTKVFAARCRISTKRTFWRLPHSAAPTAGKTRSMRPSVGPLRPHPWAVAPQLIKFTAFDPATKMSEATVTDAALATARVVKGAYATIIGLAPAPASATAAAAELEGQGYRVLAVAAGRLRPPCNSAGLIALSDPPCDDSRALVSELNGLGVRTVMVTGDAAVTAAIVARPVGLEGAVCPPGPIPDAVSPEQFAVFAGVLPEDKYKLIVAFQKSRHIVGMCGDGANDAPALRQAQIGIAVCTATDVAKSAAGMVLTKPGLAGIVAAVKEGRVTFQRILTYTLNSIIKKIVQVLFLIVGLIVTGHAILTPLLMVIVMITGDFLSMSLTTDNVRPSPPPNAWRIGNLTFAGVSWVSASWSFAAPFWPSATRDGVRDRGTADPGLCRHCIRQSSDNLCHSRTPASVVVSPKRLAGRIVGCRYSDCLDIGHRRSRDDALPALMWPARLRRRPSSPSSDLVKVPAFRRLGIA